MIILIAPVYQLPDEASAPCEQCGDFHRGLNYPENVVRFPLTVLSCKFFHMYSGYSGKSFAKSFLRYGLNSYEEAMANINAKSKEGIP